MADLVGWLSVAEPEDKACSRLHIKAILLTITQLSTINLQLRDAIQSLHSLYSLVNYALKVSFGAMHPHQYLTV